MVVTALPDIIRLGALTTVNIPQVHKSDTIQQEIKYTIAAKEVSNLWDLANEKRIRADQKSEWHTGEIDNGTSRYAIAHGK